MFHRYILPVSVICFIIAGILFVTQVFAVKPDGVGKNTNPGLQRKINIASLSGQPSQDGDSSQSGKRMGPPPFAKIHLDEVKLKVCEKKAENITKRSTHLVELVDKMIKVFTSIAGRVEQYYLTKVVPAGSTLPTYDALVAEIATKQNALTPLVEAAQADATNFSCTGNNPKAQLTQYRSDMQAVIQGLKDYRTAIKNLIVAVRTLKSLDLSGTPSATPSVTLIPTATSTPIITATPTP